MRRRRRGDERREKKKNKRRSKKNRQSSPKKARKGAKKGIEKTKNPSLLNAPTDEEIAEAIEGNLCRCTGYQQIIESIKDGS